MKEIKKNSSLKSKVKGKDVKFNIDLDYSPEYDSFNIKVKKGEGFMSYTDALQGLPLEVVQKINEMLEEVLVKSGSKTEMMEDLEVELGAEPNPNHSLRSHEGSVKIKTQKVKVKSLSEAQNKVRGFIDENDLGSGNFTGGDLFSHGKKIGRVSYNGRVWNLKDEPMKMADGGDFQSGVYNRGGAVKNERLHVNKDEDYEVRYSKPRPHRKGYKGLRNFEGGGMFGENSKVEKYSVYIEYGNDDDNKMKVVELDFPTLQQASNIYKKYSNSNSYKGEEILEMIILKYYENGDYEQVENKYSNGGYVEITDPKRDLFDKGYAIYGGDAWEKLEDVKKIPLPKDAFIVKVKTMNNDYFAIAEKRSFNGGGEMDLNDDKRLRLRKSVMTERKYSKKEWAEKYNPRAYEFMGKDKMATGGGVGLIGNQKRIDMNKNGKIDAEDFKLLRSSMNGAWRNERKHVNHSEDYEVRYAKPRPKRTGYKGKRNFMSGGKMKKAESGTEVKKGVKGGIMTLAKKIRKDGESWQDAVKRAGQQLK